MDLEVVYTEGNAKYFLPWNQSLRNAYSGLAITRTETYQLHLVGRLAYLTMISISR